ncbi:MULTISPECIES: hypothetical protein [Kurthia]|uniref:hypothetical protein n=1 Tax=Kurthia TaxID=1649 RepID=UPI002DB62724|nr:hypothetical protein [Kurthia gibsonii]MEB7771605.1 hypothetical protein [Kurthia gibsonii]
MNKENLFETNSDVKNDVCKCDTECTCGKATNIFKQFSEEHFLPTSTMIIEWDDEFEELIDYIGFDDEEFLDDDEDSIRPSVAKKIPVITPYEIERRKSDVKGTAYFNNDYAIAKCHLVITEVAFKNEEPEQSIIGYVKYATEGNYEILELRNDYVKFIAHYEPQYFDGDDILNYSYEVFGNETHAIVCVNYL